MDRMKMVRGVGQKITLEKRMKKMLKMKRR